MNQITPGFLARSRQVFKETWPTLAEVQQKILQMEQSNLRRDILSSLEALKRSFKVDLNSTPATWPVLRRIFVSNNAAQVGLSPKRYANIRSDVFRAVKLFGVPSPTLTRAPRLTTAWETLLVKVQVKNYRSALRRLASYCSAMNIAPEDVGKEALLGLYEALDAEGGVKDPKIILRHVTSYWNYHLLRVEGWPNIHLETPFTSKKYKLSLSDLPCSLQDQIAQWQDRRLGGDILSLDRIANKSRPKTVQHQTDQVLRYLGLAVNNDLAKLKDLTSLRAVLEPSLVRATLTILLKEKRLTIGYVHQYAYVLLGIARHHTDLLETEVKQLATLAANLKGEVKHGMTEKNRKLLRQFDKPENIERLIQFPDDERRRGAAEENLYRRAKFYERALVAEILIYSVLRIENVSMLRLDKNMRKRSSSYILTFTGEEMKNGYSHEVELPDWMSKDLEEFITVFRPELEGADGPFLFPGKLNGARHYSAIRTEFSRTIRKRCGFQVNPHLMRHLMSKIALDKDPSMLFWVSKRLGHRSTQTTEMYYLESDGLSASRKLSGILSNFSRTTRKTKK
jgi:integrase